MTFDVREIEASGSENVEGLLQKHLSQNRSLTASREDSKPSFADGADTVILIDRRRAPSSPRHSGGYAPCSKSPSA